MKRRAIVWAPLSALVLSIGALATSGSSAGAGGLSAPSSAAPWMALVSGPPRGTHSSLLFAQPGCTAAPIVAASFEHPRDNVVRAVVMPGTRVVVAVSDIRPDWERSWSAGLLRLEQGRAPRVLADSVYHASRPLVIDDHSVLVQRGQPGAEPSGALAGQQLRIDALRIDRVDADTGAAQTLYSWTGYETHLAGRLGDEVIVYRVGPGHADLIALRLDSGGVRPIVDSWPAAARDFSIDAAHGAVVAQQIEPGSPARWHVERIDILSGQRSVLATGSHADLMPFAWPAGALLYHPDAARTPSLLGAARSLRADLGPIWARDTSRDGAWVAALGIHSGALPRPIAIRVQDAVVEALPAAAGERVEIAGFLGSAP